MIAAIKAISVAMIRASPMVPAMSFGMFSIATMAIKKMASTAKVFMFLYPLEVWIAVVAGESDG